MNGCKMFEKLSIDLLIEEKNKGNICFFVSPGELVKVNLDEFIKQPVEGILYDLNRDEITSLTHIKNNDLKWVNNYAVAQVIKKLYKTIEDKLK